MTSPLLRAEDVARTLQTSRQTVYNLAKAGALPAIRFATKPGRETVRFREEDVTAFIERNRRAVG
ncbi:MAG: hypothetical protein Kow00128_10600 [Deltaproteobacteria bacterium]